MSEELQEQLPSCPYGEKWHDHPAHPHWQGDHANCAPLSVRMSQDIREQSAKALRMIADRVEQGAFHHRNIHHMFSISTTHTGVMDTADYDVKVEIPVEAMAHRESCYGN